MPDHYTTAIIVLTVATCSSAMVYDLRERRIPNWVTLPAILLALLLHVIYGGAVMLTDSIIGMSVGGGVLFAVYMLGGMGAGDVKLMSAAGALLGFQSTLRALLLISIIGGILALLSVTIHHLWKSVYRNVVLCFSTLKSKRVIRQCQFHEDTERAAIPYGVAIGLGTLITLFFGT